MVEDLLKCMQKYQLDYTNTFLNLSQKNSNENIFSNNDEFLIWHENWKNISNINLTWTSKKNNANI